MLILQSFIAKQVSADRPLSVTERDEAHSLIYTVSEDGLMMESFVVLLLELYSKNDF